MMTMSGKKTVVVTGIGVFTSIGCNRIDFWNSLISGKSGIKRIQAFDPDGHLSQIASEVSSFNPEDYISRKQARRMARVSQLASCAAIEAVKDAGLDLEKENPARVGCVIGSAAGDYANIEEQHDRFQQKGPGSLRFQRSPHLKCVPTLAVFPLTWRVASREYHFPLVVSC